MCSMPVCLIRDNWGSANKTRAPHNGSMHAPCQYCFSRATGAQQVEPTPCTMSNVLIHAKKHAHHDPIPLFHSGCGENNPMILFTWTASTQRGTRPQTLSAAGLQQLQVCCNSKAAAAPEAAESHTPALKPRSRVCEKTKEATQPEPYTAYHVCHMHPPQLGSWLGMQPAMAVSQG
jgi:hypothetical protein